jgi:hypothetical protein
MQLPQNMPPAPEVILTIRMVDELSRIRPLEIPARDGRFTR